MGQEIKIKILTMGGEEVEIETPVDIIADELIRELCISLHLPVTDAEGNPIQWRLDNKDTGRTLAGKGSLEIEGVKEGHRLALIRSTVAGGTLVETLPSIGLTKVNANHRERRTVKTTNIITRFLWWCSGASSNILKELSMEHVKYQAIGASILTDGMLAALSGGYSLYLVSGNLLLSILLGITWGLMIFNLTRYTVTSIKVRVKDEISRLPRIVGRVLHALPLLALSILIGLVISKPLEIALFRDVINQRMYSNNLENKEQLTKEIARTEATISALEYRLKAKDEEIVGLKNLYTSELEGGQGSSGRPGAGPLFQEIQSRLYQAIKERDQLNQETQESIYNESIHLSELKAQEAILANNNKETNGLLAQIVALSRLTKENETIAKAQLLVMLLVLLVTVAPVITKLLSPPGPYDALLERLGHGLPEEESLKIQKAFSEALDRSEFNPHK